MKLFRHGPVGEELAGIVAHDGSLKDLSAIVPDITGDVLSDVGLRRIAEVDASTLPPVAEGTRYGPCVGNIGKFICIGMNYAAHAAETGQPIPHEPVVFMKATSALSGPNDDIILPKNSTKVDWEAELGIVIGTRCSYVAEEEAAAHIAGFCVINDVSERSWQLEGTGQWTKGKSADTFGPLGPWLVTRDEIADPHALHIWLDVDDTRMQDSNTSDMIFSANTVVSYLSGLMTLHPGDVIATGTPSGVGIGQRPHQIFLKPGQTVRLGIEGLGTQAQKAVAWS